MTACATCEYASGTLCLIRVALMNCSSRARRRPSPARGTLPPDSERASDDDRGDRGQLEQLADRGRVSGLEPCGGEDAGERGKHAGDHVGRQQHPADREAGELGGASVTADGDELAAVRRAADHEPHGHRNRRRDQHDPRQIDDRAGAQRQERVVADRLQLPVSKHQRHPSTGDEHRQGGDDRLHPDEGDHRPVERSGEQPDEHRDDHRRRSDRSRCRGG